MKLWSLGFGWEPRGKCIRGLTGRLRKKLELQSKGSYSVQRLGIRSEF